MPAPFETLLAECDAEFDAAFAIRVRITPMTGSANARPTPDTSRAVWEGAAVPLEEDATGAPKDVRGTGREDRVGTTTAFTRRALSIARAALGPFIPARGDRVTLLDRAGQPVGEIARVDRADPTRLILHLDAVAP